MNLYAGIAAIVSFEFTVKEVFIMAIMLSFCHNLFIESAVASKVGIKFWVILLVRVGLALVAAFLVNLLWKGGSEAAQYGMISSQAEPEGLDSDCLKCRTNSNVGDFTIGIDSHTADDRYAMVTRSSLDGLDVAETRAIHKSDRR